MARPNPLRTIMATPLPTRTEQRKLPYRPSLEEVIYTYNIINKYVFDNELKRPEIRLKTVTRAWGMCFGMTELDQNTRSNCMIQLSDKWFCVQWMTNILAHEMAHQFQWDNISPGREDEGKDWLMSHGPSFNRYRARMKEFDISLKVSHSKKRWFATQDLFLS